MESISETIKIEVNTQFLHEQSDPAKNRFVFAYSIEITNFGNESVTLLNLIGILPMTITKLRKLAVKE